VEATERDQHAINLIIEGSDGIFDSGVPIVLHGHRIVCRCELIALGTGATAI